MTISYPTTKNSLVCKQGLRTKDESDFTGDPVVPRFRDVTRHDVIACHVIEVN